MCINQGAYTISWESDQFNNIVDVNQNTSSLRSLVNKFITC